MNITYNSNREKLITFIVPSDYDGVDARTFLKKYCNLSTRTLSKLKRTNLGISRNSLLLKTTDVLSAGDKIVLSMPDDVNDIVPVNGQLNVLFEDDYILVVDKPYMMPVHPTKVHQLDTLANIVSFYMQTKSEHYTFRAINRIDRDTSGCLIIAKDRYTAACLPDTLEKEYIAVCEGIIDSSGTVSTPIKVMPGRSIQRITSPDGERAVTHYFPLCNDSKHTLVRFNLETGKTHQIRCHMSSIGYPLAGDDMYGGSLDIISRQALHCHKLKFIHPITKLSHTVISSVPEDIASVIKINIDDFI